MMTSSKIRQSFLDFFQEKKHSIVPSASLMPTAPNLLFTNAGMNQFIPYFLGTESPAYSPPRVADTQKCIRAGGKHNDLEDVGYDSYHHTFFEMLGNWSFGDYFKEEAVQWAWELLVERWKLPPERLYATVYCPAEGDPGEFDQEAHDIWADILRKAGMDPAVHIVSGNKKDNFWMMGETGPCGPCSEIHVDLTPNADTRGSLVNQDDPRCIEVWNLVFIQSNANEDGTFRPLPARHVDTGMGFERIVSILQGTRGLSDFSRLVSNYDTDVFSPIFARLTELSGKSYGGTLPSGGKRHGLSEQEQIDVAFRVIGDHIRTTSFAIADGIEPGNGGRNYVIRNILRRAVRFGRLLGFGADQPFLHQLVAVLAEQFGQVFPELKARREKMEEILAAEEEQFNRTLDRGLNLFDAAAAEVADGGLFPATTVVKLWETYGFPTDLTALLLDERNLKTDDDLVSELVQEHKHTGTEGQKAKVIKAVSIETDEVTEFVGYDCDEVDARVLEWIEEGDHVFAVVDKSPFYVEKGGQVGDRGVMKIGGESIAVSNCLHVGEAAVLEVEHKPGSDDDRTHLSLDTKRRRSIEGHHTATHLFHWALHEVVSSSATQQGSLVAADRLRFDFNSKPLSAAQLSEIQSKVNRCIESDDPVICREAPHSLVSDNPDVMQFFGDKYGDVVRVVQIGGHAKQFDGYSMELCGGTHVKSTGEIGFFKIKSEGAVAAGIRRIEAVCGDSARRLIAEEAATVARQVKEIEEKLAKANEKLSTISQSAIEVEEAEDFTDKIENFISAGNLSEADAVLREFREHRNRRKALAVKADKALKKASAGAAAKIAATWYEENLAVLEADGKDQLVQFVGLLPGNSPALLQEAMNQIKARQFHGIAVLGVIADGALHLGAVVHPDATDQCKAWNIVRQSLAVAGGKGGGKPEMARGAAPKAAGQADAVLAKAKELLGIE